MSGAKVRGVFAMLMVAGGLLFTAGPASAHCDGMDGPVVAAGQRSLATGDVRHALVWVLADAEAEVRSAFSHAVEVRALGAEARELADRFFLETLVRVHRAGEGAPFTGLKPAGRDPGAAVRAADRAIESGSVAELEALLVAEIRQGLEQHFHDILATRGHAPVDVDAGREFVKAYVGFLHYVEAVEQVASRSATDVHDH